MDKQPGVFNVSQINRYLKDLVHGDLCLQDLWVTGEISNYKRHHSGHIYFTLKDSAASLRCVFFKRENRRCPFEPEEGMEVILHGRISIYELGGLYQLYVDEMQPSGMGSLFVAFEQLKKKLEDEGLFNPEHKQKLPALPRKIALVTSPGGAALQDILATVKKRFPHVHLLVAESLVQGPGAAPDIVRAIKMLNRKGDIDLIVLARGGGSLEDLWPFNEETVARAIFNSQIPVISAVGHETDFTIADFTADFRAHTPTQAGVAAVPVYEDLLKQLQQWQNRAELALKNRLQQEKQSLDYILGERFIRIPSERVKSLRRSLENLETGLKRESARSLETNKVHIFTLAGRLDSCSPLKKLKHSGVQLAEREAGLRREMVRLLQMKGIRLASLTDKLESYSPLKVMNRGYSYCRDEEGRVIRSVKDIRVGSLLRLKFKDGRAFCRTERIEEDQSIE